MKFRRLEIGNFRAIGHALFDGLEDLVLIAGPNGVGKSSVLDAIRLLKSVVGGYQPDEINSWLAEFQIKPSLGDANYQKLFRSTASPIRVSAQVELAATEIDHIRTNADSLMRTLAWRLTQVRRGPGSHVDTVLANETGPQKRQVDDFVSANREALLEELNSSTFEATAALTALGGADVDAGLVLKILWSTFDPEHMGIIDFHGPNRTYGYEQSGAINLNIEQSEQRIKQHALYQTQNKYSNIKAEMAAAYLRDLISADAASRQGIAGPRRVTDSLKELFSRFFPGKMFLGAIPSPDGTLSFPVQVLCDGSTHDVNSLSSGEKEVLFGYLRLHNSAPRQSVILMDEPELHLNPRIVAELPRFYHEEIGKKRANQMWLVTHSDAFLRDALTIDGASVWHMRNWQPAHADNNQAGRVIEESAAAQLVVDLTGELGGFRPDAKILVVEGADSEFDKRAIERLFPDVASRLNIISAGSRTSAERLHELLAKATQATGWSAKFHVITDRDLDQAETVVADHVSRHQWDAYHIENYLLEPRFIAAVVEALDPTTGVPRSEDDIRGELERIAASKVDDMVRMRLHNFAHRAIQASVTIRCDKAGSDLAVQYRAAVERSGKAAQDLLSGALSEAAIKLKERALRTEHEDAVRDGTWNKVFKGRDVLVALSRVYGVQYHNFRNLIIARMRDARWEPPGMKVVLERCLV